MRHHEAESHPHPNLPTIVVEVFLVGDKGEKDGHEEEGDADVVLHHRGGDDAGLGEVPGPGPEQFFRAELVGEVFDRFDEAAASHLKSVQQTAVHDPPKSLGQTPHEYECL